VTHNPPDDGAGTRRYLALVFPSLPIERLRSTRPHLFVARDRTPVAFVAGRGKDARLVAVDPAAAHAGLTPGLTAVEARTRVADLELFDADPPADHAWLERLAEAGGRYSPAVALYPPDALILAIAGSSHGFDDERSLAADVEARFARRGIAVRHAFGDAPAIAEALARFAGGAAPDERGAVRRLPLAALNLDDDAVAAMQHAGLRHVGDVMTQPRGAIAARFGTAAAAAVCLLAAEASPASAAPPGPAPIGAERRFAKPIARPELVMEAVTGLVDEAGAVLAARGQGARRWRLRLYGIDGEVRSLQVQAPPTGDAAGALRLLRERIARAGEVEPGGGYDLIRLDVPLAECLHASRLRLEGGGGRPDAIGEPPDRPTAPPRRVAGRERLPEQAELMLPLSAPLAPPPCPLADVGEAAPRPIHLFDPPQPLDRVAADLPDGAPLRFRWRRTLHEVARVEGPERIAGERWRRPGASGSGAATRDYFRIEDRRGRRLWIFRQAGVEETGRPRWYVHGVFA
jgi:protein ImuB